MSGKTEPSSKFDRLRQQAEVLISKWPDFGPTPSIDTLELIDELKIHQAELEIQNEELKQAHDELSELHREYEVLYEYAPCGYITLNARGMVTHANLTAAGLLGTEKKIFSSSGFSRFVAPGWENAFGDVLQKAGETCRKQSIEVPLKSEKDSTLWARMNIETDRDATGTVEQWRIVLVDITQRKVAEAALAKSEERFRDLFEKAPVAYQSLDAQGNFIEVNETWLSMLGYTKEDVIGNHFSMFLHPDWKEHFQEHFPRFKAVGEVLGAEFVMRKKDGTDVLVASQGKIGTNARGEFQQTHCVFQDITMLRKAETDRKQLEDWLIESQKMDAISTLAGGIAHDFNNMLGVISGNVSMALSVLNEDHELYKMLSDAQEGAKQAQHLTHQLLTFARGGEPVKSIADINSLLQETVRFATSGTKARCDFNLADNVSPVEVDAGQFHQAISNLIINAIQAMPEGGIIQIETENTDTGSPQSIPLPQGAYVRINIADHGTGIPPEHMSKIFNPFYTTKHQGNGLGLATTFSIIRRHHGYISVESEPGVGTTFNIYLPVSEKSIQQVEHKKASLHQGHGKVLAMDDQLSLLKMVGKMLNSMGYEAVFATDGAQAIEMFRDAQQSQSPFDLVILDLTVPGGIGGAEAITELLKMDPNVKVIVSSGYSNDPVMANYQDYGFCGVIPKPYTRAQMAELLNKILGKGDA